MHRNDYDVTGSIQTTSAQAVGAEVVRLYGRLYPHANAQPLERAFADAARIYEGGDPAYWPCDTEYHDIQHVLDVTLAMARLMDGYERSREPRDESLDCELFIVGALAALFHDFGYLRKRSDHRHRYGAEYTIMHVSRSAAFLRSYVRSLGLPEPLARLAGTLPHFTGYERRADKIRIGAGLPRRLGQLLGTADIIAQMSDRCYLEKCRDRLYPEFVLGALGAPRGAPPLPSFASGQELVSRTPSFYEGATRRLDAQLDRSYEYAARYFGGPNLYLDGMRKNVSYASNPAAVLRRQPPYTLLPDVEPYPRDLVRLAH
jgi:hypothetical protein